MSDLTARLRRHVDAAAPPIDVRALVDHLQRGPGVTTVRSVRDRMPNWAYAIAAAVVVLVVIGGVVWWFTGTDTIPTVDTPVPPTTIIPPVPETTTTTKVPETTITTAVPETTPAEFAFTGDDLCDYFTGDEILGIVAAAYTAEGVEFPIPDTVEARPTEWYGYPACDWTLPGTPGGGWGSGVFTVHLGDHSDIRFFSESGGQTGPTHLEDYHQSPWGDSAALYGVDDLVPQGVVFLGGFSPGFDVYVEKTDRLLNFRHDLATSAQQQERLESPDGLPNPTHYRIEVRILTAMLEQLGWLPEPDFIASDLCDYFTGDEILDIVAAAYTAEGVDYPIRDAVEAQPTQRDGYPACDWTLPEEPGGGWPSGAFTVHLGDISEYPIYEEGDGPPILPEDSPMIQWSYLPWDDSGAEYGVDDLVPAGVSFLGGWSPGFDVYVEKTYRKLNFRHDLSASAQQQERLENPDGLPSPTHYRIEVRILAAMLEQMGWLP